MDKQKCIKALLDNLYEVYLQEGTIEKYQSHIQWAFKEAINNMRCFFKNDSFSCENEYRVILKIPEELLLEETTGQDGILKKGQFKRENILIPYVDYKFKRDAIMLTIHFMTPTSYPKKSPKASLAYRYGPPDCSNMLPHSAKHSATDITKIRTKRYASKLDGPIN